MSKSKGPRIPRGPAKKPGKSRPGKKGGYIEKAIASLQIVGAAEMTARGRRQVAAWLLDQAEMLTAHGSNYAKRFRGRYLVPS